MNTLKNLLPKLPDPKVRRSRTAPTEKTLGRLDALIVFYSSLDALQSSKVAGSGPLARLAERQGTDAVLTAVSANNNATLTVGCQYLPKRSRFEQQTLCRNAAKSVMATKPGRVGVVVIGESDDEAALLEDACYALTLAAFTMPKFSSQKQPVNKTPEVTVYSTAKPNIKRVLATARGNCLARWLTAMPPSHLDGYGYRELAEHLAKKHGWRYRFLSAANLKRKGAGAFAAVAQGNEDDSAGIVHLQRKAKGKRARQRIALVGKGIIFDTGGNNLKPFNSMLNMHIDMGGSAVAMGSLLALHELDAGYDIDVWLGITENRIGPRAYKSQDVVKALNGKTIQTIHTDAEGRMVLADTLTLAGREKPDVMLNFATLTGACVNAVTTRYAGVFTNRESLHSLLIQHGRDVGERVWPFTIGGEFLDVLKSETADIQQCSPGDGGDHILAATFLNEFVPGSVPWVHMDLSAVEHKGGLGAVATDITGFGVAYTVGLLQAHGSTLQRARRST